MIICRTMVPLVSFLAALRILTEAQSCNNGVGKLVYEKISDYKLSGTGGFGGNHHRAEVISRMDQPVKVLEECVRRCQEDRTTSIQRCLCFDFQPGRKRSYPDMMGNTGVPNTVGDYEESTCYMYQVSSDNGDTLVRQVNSYHMNEVCLTSTKVSTECPNRLYVFKRIPGYRFKCDKPKEIFATNRTECEDKCLNEYEFVCRSATYDRAAQRCRICRETRTMSPIDFTAEPNSDYLENMCLSSNQRCTTVAFILEAGKELDGAFERERINVRDFEECSKYCVRYVDERGLMCELFLFDESTRSCVIYDEDSYDSTDGERQRPLKPSKGDLYRVICGTSDRDALINNATFECYRRKRLDGSHQMDVKTYSFQECLDECMRRYNKDCRSVEYSSRYQSCRFSSYESYGTSRPNLIDDDHYDFYEFKWYRGGAGAGGSDSLGGGGGGGGGIKPGGWNSGSYDVKSGWIGGSGGGGGPVAQGWSGHGGGGWPDQHGGSGWSGAGGWSSGSSWSNKHSSGWSGGGGGGGGGGWSGGGGGGGGGGWRGGGGWSGGGSAGGGWGGSGWSGGGGGGSGGAAGGGGGGWWPGGSGWNSKSDYYPPRGGPYPPIPPGPPELCKPGGPGAFKRVGYGMRLRSYYIRRVIRTEKLEDCERACVEAPDFLCKSFNFRTFFPDNCELSDKDTNKQLQPGNPSFFEQNTQFDYYEREVGPPGLAPGCLDVGQTCTPDGMEFTLRTTEGFFGRIYTYGFYDSCFFDGNGGKINVLRISRANGFPRCGTQQYGDVMTNIVVVQFNDYVQTSRDKKYNLTCYFSGPGEAVVTSNYLDTRTDGRYPAQIEHLPAQNILTSNVVLRILYRGTPTNVIAVGDLLTFRLEARGHFHYDIHSDIFAINVIAKDPYSGRKVHLIDPRGCPVDLYVFPELHRTPDGALQAEFYAFKIPDSNLLVFQATVRTCRGPCEPILCSDRARPGTFPSWGRKKRSINGTLVAKPTPSEIENNSSRIPGNENATIEEAEEVHELLQVYLSRSDIPAEVSHKTMKLNNVCVAQNGYYAMMAAVVILLGLAITVSVLAFYFFRKSKLLAKASATISSIPNGSSAYISQFQSPKFEDPSEPIYTDPSLFERSRSLRSLTVTALGKAKGEFE